MGVWGRGDRPPEPGFARREAHYAKDVLQRNRRRRLLKRKSELTARKEGPTGEPGGSPVKRGYSLRAPTNVDEYQPLSDETFTTSPVCGA